MYNSQVTVTLSPTIKQLNLFEDSEKKISDYKIRRKQWLEFENQLLNSKYKNNKI